jgi:hypothetical protein
MVTTRSQKSYSYSAPPTRKRASQKPKKVAPATKKKASQEPKEVTPAIKKEASKNSKQEPPATNKTTKVDKKSATKKTSKVEKTPAKRYWQRRFMSDPVELTESEIEHAWADDLVRSNFLRSTQVGEPWRGSKDLDRGTVKAAEIPDPFLEFLERFYPGMEIYI